WNAGFPDEDLSPFSKVTRFGWPGADNSNHFFTVEDLFDKSKVNTIPNSSNAFPDRLSLAGRMRSSYDTSRLYRLLSQLGTDSEPEPPDKMNLNWDNLVQSTNGMISATNFIPWRPLDFFTNAAIRLLTSAGYAVGSNGPRPFTAW